MNIAQKNVSHSYPTPLDRKAAKPLSGGPFSVPELYPRIGNGIRVCAYIKTINTDA
jgi:hypothetical protein